MNLSIDLELETIYIGYTNANISSKNHSTVESKTFFLIWKLGKIPVGNITEMKKNTVVVTANGGSSDILSK